MTHRKKRIELDDDQGRASATEKFLIRLHRSTELLRENRPEDARKTLEDAFDAQADDPSGQASLALVYFKLGLYPRALSLYRKLVEEYPVDPVLTLNLALVLFKTGQTAEARDVLERVVALAPNYLKAYGYLGLAHQRLGDYRRAYEAFKCAGTDHMAERLNRFVEPDGEAAYDSGIIDLTTAKPSLEVEAESQMPPDLDDKATVLPTPSSVPPALCTVPPTGVRRLALEDPNSPIPVEELVDEARVRTPRGGRFVVTPSGYLVVDVAGRVRSRLSGLHFCSGGGLVYRPLERRRRSSPHDEPNADGIHADLCEIDGIGKLGFHPKSGTFKSISLSGEAAYFREERLFAFDPDLEYEHGRIPGGEISLVQLSGNGSAVFVAPAHLHALEVSPDAPVVIPSDGLVGWFGRLIPQFSSAPGPFAPALQPLEMSGEGVLLFCLS